MSLIKVFEDFLLITFDTAGTISFDAAAIVEVRAGTASVDSTVGNEELTADADTGCGVSRTISSELNVQHKNLN